MSSVRIGFVAALVSLRSAASCAWARRPGRLIRDHSHGGHHGGAGNHEEFGQLLDASGNRRRRPRAT